MNIKAPISGSHQCKSITNAGKKSWMRFRGMCVSKNSVRKRTNPSIMSFYWQTASNWTFTARDAEVRLSVTGAVCRMMHKSRKSCSSSWFRRTTFARVDLRMLLPWISCALLRRPRVGAADPSPPRDDAMQNASQVVQQKVRRRPSSAHRTAFGPRKWGILNAVQKTSTHYLGRDCAAIETQIVSTSLLDRVPYLYYCTEAVSVEIRHQIRDRKRPPCNKQSSAMLRSQSLSWPHWSRSELTHCQKCSFSITQLLSWPKVSKSICVISQETFLQRGWTPTSARHPNGSVLIGAALSLQGKRLGHCSQRGLRSHPKNWLGGNLSFHCAIFGVQVAQSSLGCGFIRMFAFHPWLRFHTAQRKKQSRCPSPCMRLQLPDSPSAAGWLVCVDTDPTTHRTQALFSAICRTGLHRPSFFPYSATVVPSDEKMICRRAFVLFHSGRVVDI